jgi:hypothetical protein
MPELDAWTEWKRLCALGLCEVETQTALRAFACAAFRRYLGVYATAARTTAVDALAPSREDAWHRFETHLRIRNNRQGKSYKEWLFSRAVEEGSSSLDCIRGGATLLMRDVVRAYLREETAPAGTRTLDAPIETADGGGGLTLRDLLPDRADTRHTVTQNEVCALAADATAPLLAVIGRRERIALLARELGLSLAHPLVTTAAKCRKSMVFAAYRQALEDLAEGVRQRYPHFETSTMAEVCIQVFDNVRQAVVAWGQTEDECRTLFTVLAPPCCPPPVSRNTHEYSA